jgi:hypothetical protein
MKKDKIVNNRFHKITFRLTETEYLKLIEMQNASNYKVSEYVRQAVLNSTVKAKMSEEERKYFRMLVGLSTNLNQLAHKANANIDFINLALDIQKTRREIDFIISNIGDR